MTLTKKLDELANLWNKTQDPTYKDQWYKLIRTYGNNYIKRRPVSSSRSNKRNDKRDNTSK